jgi:membrane protein DedA with SNARE-associated domain
MTFAVAPGDWVRNTVSSGGYPALAGLILAENLFPPIPSELILPLAGFYVSQGEMAFVLAVLAATIGSLAGALLLYAIARFGGRKVVLRFGKVLRIKESDLDRGDEWFDKHGGWVVLFGRLVPGARSLVSIPAGLSEMPVMRFALLTTLGSTAWNCALIGAGWGLGEHYEKVGGIVGPVGTAIVGLCALAVLALVVRAYRRRRTA